MDNVVRVLNEYGDGDSTYSSTTVFKKKYNAFVARRQAVIDYLYPMQVSWEYEQEHWQSASDDKAHKEIENMLRLAEMNNDNEYTEESDFAIIYNPHTMYFDYTHFDEDYYWCIEVVKKTFQDAQ